MQSSLEYIFIKILEPATLIYLTACIVCYSLYTIPAFPRLMNTINMNSILRPLLRNIGVILCILEGICSLRMHKGPGRLLLYGMIATAAFSSWATALSTITEAGFCACIQLWPMQSF